MLKNFALLGVGTGQERGKVCFMFPTDFSSSKCRNNSYLTTRIGTGKSVTSNTVINQNIMCPGWIYDITSATCDFIGFSNDFAFWKLAVKHANGNQITTGQHDSHKYLPIVKSPNLDHRTGGTGLFINYFFQRYCNFKWSLNRAVVK